MSDKYVLHYFEGNGRAVIPRALLTYVKADWKNDMIKHEDWPKIKKSGLCEYEQLPVLEVNGKKYSQSMAINVYLARKFNLMGKDLEDEYQIMNLLMTFEDISVPVWKWQFCPNEAEKPKLREEALAKFKFFLGKIDARYVANGKGKYFLGDTFTMADIYLGSAFPSICDSLGECCAAEVAPNLKELLVRIKSNELKEFHEKVFMKTPKKK